MAAPTTTAGLLALGLTLWLAATTASHAQDNAASPPPQEAYLADIYNAPGNYGVAYGTASFGKPRTWSAFASPYSPGYAYGYAPYTILPGPYGAGIWNQPGTDPSAGGNIAGFYRTFPVPYSNTWPSRTGPPIGFYAPAYGPPSTLPW